MRRLSVVLGLLAVLIGLGAAPALATPPSALAGTVTDASNVLSSADQQRIETAIDGLRQKTGTTLYVAFVPDFSGVTGNEWALQAGQASGLGDTDVLLAVATTAREYGYHAGKSESSAQIQDVVQNDVLPKLHGKQWADAAVAMADGLGGGAATSSSSSVSGGGLSSGAVAGIVLAVLLVAGAGSYLIFRSRRRRREEQAALPQGPRDPYEGTPTDQLNARASTALLDVDELVRTAQVNLDYARSYYGEEAVPGYAQALTQSRDELGKAFAIRQLLDDDIPEDEPTTRRMLADLLKLTGDAQQRLQAQAAVVDGLRERERTAPQAIDALLGRIGELQQRLPKEQERLADLGRRYAPSAFAAVADNVDQAGVRLAAAEQAAGEARDAQAAGNAGRAVGRLLPAEQAVQQSATLLDAVARQAGDVATAEQRVAAARSETEADLAEARALLGNGDRSGLQAAVARAQAALAAADTALRPADGGLPDPLGALRRIEQADAELHTGLQTARDAQTQARKAAAALQQALLSARSSVAAAGDFISTRRGAIGPEARTRLAEAERHLDVAQGQATSDPVGALSEAQRADQLAQYSLQVAQSDVETWSQQTGYGYGGGYGGGWGGGPGWGGGYRRGGSGLGWGLGGLLLGGLLFGDHDNDGGGWGGDGGAGWGGGGGFGGGDWGGGGDFGGGGGFGGGGDGGGSF